MKFLLLILTTQLLVACSSNPVNVKKEAQDLYSKEDKRICPDMAGEVSTRKEAAYCLGWIYLNETDKKLPAVDQLAFKDIPAGDPTVPYLWVVVSTGLMQPENPQHFGGNKTVTKAEWKNSVERMEGLIESWKENNPHLK